MTIADIYEAVYLCPYDTIIANAFRKACGLPALQSKKPRVASERKSSYAEIDWDQFMRQPYGVRM